jgi:ubiquinol-cytochrome c reductase cytochrome b subunit
MLVLALGNGFAGYSLPDDLLSGTGLRIAYSVVLSIPIIGTWLAFLVFGGPFPAEQIVGRLYIIHVLLVPAALTVLMSVHLAVIWRQKHTQFPGPGRREDNVVGTRLWPAYAAKSVGLLFLVAGVLAALGGIAQINPVWLWGPYQPAAVTTAAQPDWYVGFLEGSLRLAPPWDLTLWGHTVPEIFLPGVVLPGITFALLYAWPWIERRFTHDRGDHNLLDRPRDRPLRTAIGVGVLTFYVVLTLAGGQDIIGQHLHVPIDEVTWFLRGALLVVPLAAGGLAFRVCRDLAAGDARHPDDDAGSPGSGRTGVDGGSAQGELDPEVGAEGSPEASHAAKAPTPTTSAATPP